MNLRMDFTVSNNMILRIEATRTDAVDKDRDLQRYAYKVWLKAQVWTEDGEHEVGPKMMVHRSTVMHRIGNPPAMLLFVILQKVLQKPTVVEMMIEAMPKELQPEDRKKAIHGIQRYVRQISPQQRKGGNGYVRKRNNQANAY